VCALAATPAISCLPDATSFGNSTPAFVSLRSGAILSPFHQQVVCAPSAISGARAVALPVRFGATPNEIEINLDADGLRSLLSQLQFLKDGRTDHVHLMSESWGGTHLEDRPRTGDSAPVRHVKILLR